MNIDKLIKLNEDVSIALKRKHTLVLNPDEEYNDITLDKNIVYDKAKWKINDELKTYIEGLSKNDELSIEDKILLIYDKICKDYVYDDNLISYIKKIDDDKFSLPDWYGRDIDDEWEKNREAHNRRICFELSRYLAKSLTELLKGSEGYNVCIHWNEDLTHYFVGLSCDEYSIILDLDDFFNIKDLTRLKSGLTAEGIKILKDNENKFKVTLDKFNDGRGKYAIKKIEEKIKEGCTASNKDMAEGNDSDKIEENECIVFLGKVVEILANEDNLDSQGIFEYIKEIVDISLGSDKREKVWKKIEGKTSESDRYIRCLVLNIDNQKFIIDVDQKILRSFDEKEFQQKRAKFIPYKEISRGWFDYYDGR